MTRRNSVDRECRPRRESPDRDFMNARRSQRLQRYALDEGQFHDVPARRALGTVACDSVSLTLYKCHDKFAVRDQPEPMCYRRGHRNERSIHRQLTGAEAGG